jgi:hypothetical protein
MGCRLGLSGSYISCRFLLLAVADCVVGQVMMSGQRFKQVIIPQLEARGWYVRLIRKDGTWTTAQPFKMPGFDKTVPGEIYPGA